MQWGAAMLAYVRGSVAAFLVAAASPAHAGSDLIFERIRTASGLRACNTGHSGTGADLGDVLLLLPCPQHHDPRHQALGIEHVAGHAPPDPVRDLRQRLESIRAAATGVAHADSVWFQRGRWQC